MSNSNPIAGTYLAKGTIGNVGTPGAPIVHFSLMVTPSTHKVSGQVFVTQSVEGGDYSGNVEGTIYSTGLGKVTQIVSLKGGLSVPPPAIGVFPFEATMAIDQAWSGTGGFSYMNVHVEDVPVAIEK